MKSAVKFLSLNCWGLPFLTPQKNRRLEAIAESIRGGNWDVVALQEVWLKGDQDGVIKNSGFEHWVVFKGSSKLFGSGMILLSRHKILKSDFHRFYVSGFPHRVHEGDFHSSKGVGFALLETPLGPMPVFITHLIARYAPRYEIDTNKVFRMAQVLELVFYVRRMAKLSGFILCGDLNATDEDLEFEVLCALIGVPKSLRQRLRSDKKRLDHIICGATETQHHFKISSPTIVFKGAMRGEKIPYSDHHGISTYVRRAQMPIESIYTKKILARTWRYMNHSIEAVKQVDRGIGLIPILGRVNGIFMKPQLIYIQMLLGMLEMDLEQAHSAHPLGLKGAT